MNNQAEKFSIWLAPQSADYLELDRLIVELSDRYETLKFEPHLTLYSGACKDRDFCSRMIAEAAAGTGAITLTIGGIHATAEFFKTLFIEFEDSSRLSDLNRKIKAALNQDSGYTLKPHLSLMYKELKIDRKLEVARTISISKTAIVFDEIKLVSPGNKALGWRDVENWEVWFKSPLA